MTKKRTSADTKSFLHTNSVRPECRHCQRLLSKHQGPNHFVPNRINSFQLSGGRSMLCGTWASIAVALTLLISVVADTANEASCTTLYEKGVQAYLEDRYEDCVTHLEAAIERYRKYTKKLQNCRILCKEAADDSEPLYGVDVENLRFYEKAIRNTLCLIECQKKSELLGFYLNAASSEVFENRKPYEYLHICYFQTKDVQKAASAAFTYLVVHPKNAVMLDNLKKYTVMEGVDIGEIVNFEAKEYVYLYVHGSAAYNKKDWQGVIEYMEESISAYLTASNQCRAQCEGGFDQGWYHDFIPSIANHFTYCLRCKALCKRKLNSLNGEHHEDLFPSHYHFLQYAYYKVGKLKQACQAAATYLLFFPKDETMQDNIKFYKTLPKAEDDYFTPREEAVEYFTRDTYERKLIGFISKNFRKEQTEEPEQSDEAVQAKIRVIMDERALKGKDRFVSDGLATERECRMLVEIVKLFGVQGDGYYDNKSPHTEMERFEGITLSRAALLVYFSLLDAKYLELYLKLTEKAKKHIHNYFKLKQELYFTFTHLVCRSASPGAPLNRTDLSHAVHADNCNIFENGTCEYEYPAYTWRNYSAILYLNNEFVGGEFFFTTDIKQTVVQATVKPKCGRMVAFSAGAENLHGVRAVRKGFRCSMGLWFTFDKNHAEVDRNLIYKFL